jgi:hypothetical protein
MISVTTNRRHYGTLACRGQWTASGSVVAALFFLIGSAGSAGAQLPQSDDMSAKDEAARKLAVEKIAQRRLKFMKSSVSDYEIVLGPDFTQKLTIVPEPLLRFTNPVSGLQDGGFVIWTTEAGRPMVAAQVFLTGEDLWIHEFQSLAPVPFRVKRGEKVIWEPNRSGVEMKPVPDTAQPADNSVQRMVQMRDIAKRFGCSDEFEGRPKSDALRLLTKPLLRWSGEKHEIQDGALFVHAHGTDPELMIVIESLKSERGYRWNYALAPMTGYALKATLDEQPVWEVDWRKPPYDSKEPFFLLVHSRELSIKNLLPSP